MAIEFIDVLNIVQPADGVFAFVPSPIITTCTDADTWYPIAGTFTNDFTGAFEFDTDHIKYTGPLTRDFEIDAHIVTKGSANGIVAHFGIYLNGVIVDGSIMGTFMKTAAEPFPTSGTSVVELAADDEIQLMVMSDGAGDVITVEHLTTTIRSYPR